MSGEPSVDPSAGPAAPVRVESTSGRLTRHRRRYRPAPTSWTVGTKFRLILVAVTVSVVGMVAVGIVGLRIATMQGDERVHSVEQSEAFGDLDEAVTEIADTTREETTAGVLPARIRDLDADLQADAHLRFTTAMSELASLDTEELQFTDRLAHLNEDFATYLEVQDAIVEGARNPGVKAAAFRTELAASVGELLDRMSVSAEPKR